MYYFRNKISARFQFDYSRIIVENTMSRYNFVAYTTGHVFYKKIYIIGSFYYHFINPDNRGSTVLRTVCFTAATEV